MRDVFILGAGFSKAIAGSMPTLRELSGDVLRVIRGHKRYCEFADRLQRLFGTDVELWMNYLFQGGPWLSIEDTYYNLSLGHLIRKELAAIIIEREHALEQRPNWMTQLVELWHNRKSMIVSLNYDTLIEREARSFELPREDPRDEVRRTIHPSSLYPPYFMYAAGRGGFGLWGADSPPSFTLLKPHGSTNWYYSGQPDFHGEAILYADVRPFESKEEENAQRDPPRDKDVLIVPPVTDKTSYLKNEIINRLWREAADALRDAHRVFVIGYSLPKSDLGMRAFLRENLSDSRVESIYVINSDSSIVGRFQEQLEPCRIDGRFAKDGREVVKEWVEAYRRGL